MQTHYQPVLRARGMFARLALFLGMTILWSPKVGAQGLSSVQDYVDFDLQLANNHLWRGIEVSDGLVLTSHLAVHDKNNHVKVGFWNGTNTSGHYKEFNYFGELSVAGFQLALWDIYNFSPGTDYNNREFFNYSARSTGRFLDCILSYRFAETLPRFPLTLSWSTVLFGRDRWRNNSGNRYSCYVMAGYKIFQDKCWRFDASLGGTFTLAHQKGDRSTFYSDKPGLIHLELRAEHKLKITRNYSLPIFATAVFNPVMDRAFFQIGAQVFSF